MRVMAAGSYSSRPAASMKSLSSLDVAVGAAAVAGWGALALVCAPWSALANPCTGPNTASCMAAAAASAAVRGAGGFTVPGAACALTPF